VAQSFGTTVSGGCAVRKKGMLGSNNLTKPEFTFLGMVKTSKNLQLIPAEREIIG